MNDLIVEISPERAAEVIEKTARFIAERQMASAAILALESLKPLNYIGSQIMYFLLPFAEIFFDSKGYQEIAVVMEKDEYVAMLIRRIDELDEELHREERKQARLNRKRRWNRIKSILNPWKK